MLITMITNLIKKHLIILVLLLISNSIWAQIEFEIKRSTSIIRCFFIKLVIIVINI